MVRNSVLHLFILLFTQSGNGFQIEIAELDFIIEAKNNAVVFLVHTKVMNRIIDVQCGQVIAFQIENSQLGRVRALKKSSLFKTL